ncbi:Crp/Fnr family transcriptional regulator [Fibrella sp. HMF5335]|uniref:Crp/Fnr family transcriptional regulator n=1 Tax=Fibrella rubiginis TaxID=2817060 RepID=A0A939GCC2_9BACT|nr:Crp/Fnr family transcriptional regulator [Fibrella rubiginis]MBO0936319.1 Crp/Fnr family transcriptional regulator [Fibrella rubiginis]
MQEQLDILRMSMLQWIPLDEALWTDLQQRLQYRTYQKRDVLVAEGQLSREIAFVVRGGFRYHKAMDGEEVTTYFSFENDWIGAYADFVRQSPSEVTIEAMETGEVLVLGYNDMQAMYQRHPLFERFGRLIAEHLLTCFGDRMASLLLKTPEERYEKTLADNRHYVERVPQHYIASYLGIRPESLSRLRNRMMRKAVL